MRSIAEHAYKRTKVGERGWMRPDLARGETLEAFQAVVIDANRMQEEGKILVYTLHRENMSGKNYVDAIPFMRMK